MTSYCVRLMAQHEVAARAEPNPFATDPSDELPVGLQLTWRLRALISTGQLARGERLPSFRRLAEWAGVNLNTVRAVYEGLEEDGLVVSRQGQGTFVADGVEPAPAAGGDRRRGAAPRPARPASARASWRSSRWPARASPAALGRSRRRTLPPGLPDLEEESEAIEVRQELRRQIGRLEAELASYTRDLSAELPTAPRRAVAHVAGVEELEQTRDTLIAQLSEAQKAAEQRARQEAQTRARRQRAREGGESEHGAAPGGGPLGRAMSWWRAEALERGFAPRQSRCSWRWGRW